MPARYTEPVHVLVDKELLKQLRREAEARGLGISALVRWALLRFFDNDLVRERTLVDPPVPYRNETVT